VGKGLLADGGAKVLLAEHWLEVADPKHRYGEARCSVVFVLVLDSNRPTFAGSLLTRYHDVWKVSEVPENFFYWLDYGAGRDVELPECSRHNLDTSVVKYLGPEERLKYLVTIREGLLWYHDTDDLVHTDDVDGEHSRTNGSGKREKWIYIVDPKGAFFVAKKVRGRFHHSSFLSGGPAKAAGNLTIQQGRLVRLSPSSGHYQPTPDDHAWFLELLRLRGVDLSGVILEDFKGKWR